MATIYQVAEHAGVSLATVSRVVNKNVRVSEKTKLKVQKAMAELGYRPNAAAKSLASNRSDSIGILVAELDGPFYGPMMSGIETELRKANKHTIITAGHSDEQKEKEGIEFLVSRSCDALILHVEAVSDEYLIELAKGSTPIVLINRYIEALADRCIILNNELGGYLATKALIDLGHKSFAYIAGPLWKVDVRDRFSGHQKALAEAGLVFDESLLAHGNFQEQGGYEAFNQLKTKQHQFSALVCGNDEMASGAMSAAHDAGLELPNQLSVIGYDNIIFSNYTRPKLTTICYPVKDMGMMAAQFVLKNIYKQDQFELQLMFEPKLVPRESMAKPFNPQTNK